ncbi:transglutaminase-like domain-containing protein [Acididesulfobacillus acetoxydans]|uniref:transglutaminase-like domain-containing protein n=1 Tax=Acididesulfobacillus acetoxydans TaxID=1561005 RepID=UPI001F0EA5B5|nr:transglutaminase-like domain-containing protein [Acididesulfobacillus acetoxydans]
MQEIFVPGSQLSWALLFLPFFFCLSDLPTPAGPLSRLRTASALLLPMLATDLITHTSPVRHYLARDLLTRNLTAIWPWAWNFRHVSLAVYYPLQGLVLGTLIFLALLKRRPKIWPWLVLVTLLNMFLFSYVKRIWSFTIPLNFASAIVLQFTLTRQTNLGPGSAFPAGAMPGPDGPRSRNHSAGARIRALWLIPITAIPILLGLTLPTLSPIWFQYPLTVNSILGQSSRQGLDDNSLFAWKTDQLGGPWLGDNTPLFYVQGPAAVYWRSQAYDFYDPRGWWSESGSPTRFNIRAPIRFSAQGPERFQVLSLLPLAPDTGLPLPEQTTSLDQISRPKAAFNYESAMGTLWSNQLLPVHIRYTLHADKPVFDPTALRQSPASGLPSYAVYPKWNPHLMHRGDEIVRLTHRLTDKARTPYDKVQALVAYLKNNMTYTLDPPRAAGRDFVPNFLLVTHEGYCIHFASALAVMTKILGYPTRLVMGFTAGQPLPATIPNPFPGTDRNTVRVLTREDAHSWVEVYFSGHGWVPFEPTPGFAIPQAPADTSQPLTGTTANSEPPAPSLPLHSRNASPPAAPAALPPSASARHTAFLAGAAISVILILLAAAGARRFLRHRRWQAMSHQQRLLSLYWDLLAQAAKKGLKHGKDETPAEFLRHLPSCGPEWEANWAKAAALVEEGLFGSGDGATQVRDLSALKPEIERMLRHHSRT